jgi:two-component system sensor histidine kinase QseC
LSIQTQLIKLIIALITIATFIAALHGYRNSQTLLNDVLDNELQTLAFFILSNQNSKNPNIEPLVFPDKNPHINKSLGDNSASIPSQKAYQLFTLDGNLLAKSENAPRDLISKADGFSEHAFSGERWRTYRLSNNDTYVVVAQPDEYRRNVTEEMLLATIVPIVFSIPFIGLLVFYIIRKSLSPLRQLSSQLTNKHSEDLTGIDMKAPANELVPVVERLNALFKRLASSFELEKQLSANAAHELRTPISVLSIATNNLISEFNKGRLTSEHFIALNKNVDRMAEVIEQIIGLFRFSADTIDGNKSKVDIQKILQEVISNNYLSLEKENQSIELEAESSEIFACEFALYVLFENLLKNANKYGGNNCTIHIFVTDQQSNIKIDVHDSGKGLAAEDMAKLTTRFYRAENQTSIKGSGLGLAISKHIVNLHLGSLQFLSSPYGGLQVQVILPKGDANVA